MKALWQPRAVAVIGASATAGSLGHRLLGYVRDHGYQGEIYPVNPRVTEIDGIACYPTVSAAPGPVDLALVLVAAERVMGALEDCAAKGVPYVVVHSSGFSETGPQGRALEEQIVTYAREHGMRLIGPNCIGMVNPPDHLVAGFSPLFSRVKFEPGNLGLVTQSGALGYGIVSLAVEQGLHFSRVVNTGNESDLGAAELVRDLLEDDVTRAVLVYAEGLKQAKDWRGLGALAVERGKPIIMLKAGRSEVGGRAAASHTAALAGDDKVWDASFRQLGFYRVDDIEEMLDLAEVFAQPKRASGHRVGVLTTSGGAGIMAADALGPLGLDVPTLEGETRAALEAIIPAFGSAANPVDVTAQVINDSELFRRSLRVMAADPTLDMLMVCFCVLQGAEAERVVSDLLAIHAETAKPILVSRTGGEFLAPGAAAKLRAAGIPVYRTPARAAHAASALARFGTLRPGSVGAPLPAPGPVPAGWPAPGQALTEREAKQLLGAAGLPVTKEVLATTAEEAADAAAGMGFPVVLKIDSPDIPHKTEAGGLKLGLRDVAAVRAAFDEIIASVRRYKPDARLNGCLVQEQVENAVAEVLVGVTPSPMGPMISVGMGGIFVEVFGDVTQRMAPVAPHEARAMLEELRSFKLLSGARGRAPADLDALVDLIVRVSKIAAEWPGEWELDLNPVLALKAGNGCRIADALLIAHE